MNERFSMIGPIKPFFRMEKFVWNQQEIYLNLLICVKLMLNATNKKSTEYKCLMGL